MKLAEPAWLVLLVLLPLLGAGAFFAARLRRKQWSAFVAPRLRPMLLRRGSSLPRWIALMFLFAACAALVAAMARPQGDAGTRTEKTLGRNVLIALDLSRSMRVKDVKPDRLAQAKMVIYELLDAMPNERVGLIGFAGDAYVYAPLTVDHGAVRETVEQIDENWTPSGGSNLADAVKLATETLRNTGQRNNALVILSDGEKHDGDIEDMISEAEHSGVYILAVGVGTEDGDYVPNPDFADGRMLDRRGQPVISRLQPEVMRQLAAETKGRFAVAGSGADIPAMVKAAIKDLDSFEIEGRERRVSVEFYQWLLLPAIVFLMGCILAGTRWRGVNAAALAAAALLVPSNARADAESAARNALEQKHWRQAREAYAKLAKDTNLRERKARFHLGEATAAYRGGDYKHARSAYSAAMLSRDPEVQRHAHLGMGNALFQLGWRNLTDTSYPADPSQVPDLRKFDDLVRERLDKLKQNSAPADGEPTGYARIRTLVTNWSDAVRHYDSKPAGSPPDPAARANRELTMAYLKRLQELLKEDKQKTEDSMPQPQPDEDQPRQGEGEPDEKRPGEQDDNGEPPENPQGQGEENPDEDGSGRENEQPEKGGGAKDEENESAKGSRKPDESPEEHARRQLKENADSEKGPLTPGRREFRPPEKDW